MNLRSASVGRELDFGGATFHHNVDVTGTTVIGDFLLGSTRHTRPQWDPASRLVLRNTIVGGLQDRIDPENGEDHDAWPDSLQLGGFVYGHLGGIGEDEQDKMINRDTAWYLRWIKRDVSFSPQPYQQLAKVFQEMGFPRKAEDILYAARAEERSQTWTRHEYLRWFGLSLLQFIVGHGIGSYAFRVLFWVIGFAIFGTGVLWRSMPARAKGLLWCFAASLDQLLPIVRLNKEFDDFFNDPNRERLKGWQMAYFAFQALTGYVFASFLVAAMAGLTQTS